MCSNRNSWNWRIGLTALLLTAMTSLGCRRAVFKEAQKLGGVEIPASVLNRGNSLYMRLCVTCHGRRGDGKAPGQKIDPPPRDFRGGVIKFASVRAGKLPTDADLLRTLNYGLKGTHMPSYASLPRADKLALVHFLKTFSPRFRRERPGKPVGTPHNPWARDKIAAAIIRGRRIYHRKTRCWQCHPAYVRRDKLQELMKPLPQSERLSLRRDLFEPQIVSTTFGPLRARDFLTQQLKSGNRLSDIYRTIAAGVGGTPMTAWDSRLKPLDLWALTHYVKAISELRGSATGKGLQNKLKRN